MGLTLAQLSSRLRCAECGGPLHSIKPWRVEDVSVSRLGGGDEFLQVDYLGRTMLFTRLGYAVAVIALVVGVANLVVGIMIATESLGPGRSTCPLLSKKETSGEVIDRAIYMALFGIALGILTEIRYALRAPDKSG